MFESWTALFFNLFKKIFFSTYEKSKLQKGWKNIFSTFIFGWFLYLSIAFKVKCLDTLWGRLTATILFFLDFQIFSSIREIVIEGICNLHIITYKLFFSLDSFFSERKDLVVYQYFCYQGYSFRLSLQNIHF